MDRQPFLSIVTPTLGRFSADWLEQLLQVRGSVEFVLVYPPNEKIQPPDDPRLRVLYSAYRGEFMQRVTGLLNARGQYVLALDDDDFIHPDVVEIAEAYFHRFSESWVLRLNQLPVDIFDAISLKRPWQPLPDVQQLEICCKTPENPFPFQQGNYQGLLEVPIAPLEKKVDWRYLLMPWIKRTDGEGYHFENFNNIIWSTERVKPALAKLVQSSQLISALTLVPSWTLDRSLGLYLQAQEFEKEIIIGHWMPKPEQIRRTTKPPELRPLRTHIASDFLLLKSFPQYGYFWNIVIHESYGVLKTIARSLKRQHLFSQAYTSQILDKSQASVGESYANPLSGRSDRV
ncbi:glycosyltransferase family 2 protein [Geitlerinema splendidum]|nr:glycosyltransferase family 2 protein [Geitlerinema splendidum]